MRNYLKLAFLLTLVAVVLTRPSSPIDEEAPNCGYDACHPIKPDMLNVHIVPHTHDDVGWLKTVDQYYYGTKNRIQQASVQYILDSVIDELLKDKNKRFIYVETAYFWKWWTKQDDTLRHRVKQLVNRGQLEFIGGAWSMNDEAATNYQSIIDQFTWGLRKLNNTFGDCARPRTGWQIDPFGHSREMASIFAQLGFDGMLFGRLDYQDKTFRLQTKTAEMVWQGSASLGKPAELFTSILYNNYGPPPGFCFDVLCGDDPIIEDKNSPEYNIDHKVRLFLGYAILQSNKYRSNNIILTMGEDFNYQDAHRWFVNLDKIIRYANEMQKNGSDINLIYSTPSCYLKAVYEENKYRKWPVKSDDFFPYASDPHAYWTGYFTSRPTIKRYERMGNNFLQVCKQLYSLADMGSQMWQNLNTLREAMGVMQHHDAITGTEKEHVAHDYSRILSEGFHECEVITNAALSKLASRKIPTELEIPKLSFETCNLLNISQCEITENQRIFVVTLYNPLSHEVSQYVRLPVTGTAYSVTDPNGLELKVQIVPIPEPVQKIPGRMSSATVELVFLAENIPPLGYHSYYVREGRGDMTTRDMTSRDKHHLDNGKIHVQMDKRTKNICHLGIKQDLFELQQDFWYYQGMIGNNEEFKNRSSGAYIFRPNGSEAVPLSKSSTYKIYKGPLVEEIHQTFNEWVSRVVRTYTNENHVEFEWLVGPIPVDDNIGKEVITRFTTKMNTNGVFYTDSNGREMLKRVRNYRPTWKVNIAEPVAGNYYPVTSKISIKDDDGHELAVLTDRAQGGSSLQDGQVELMVHRRLLHDDAFGVGEALNEKAFGTGLVARGHHYVVAGNSAEIAAAEKDIAQRKLLSAWTFITPVSATFAEYRSIMNMKYAGLKESLPRNVHILTLEPWKRSSFLIRLEHIFENGEDPNLSKEVTVDIQNIFTPFTIETIEETTLGANQWLKDNKRFNWMSGKSLDKIAAHFTGDVYDEDTLRLSYLRKHINEISKSTEEEEDVYLRYNIDEQGLTPANGTVVILSPMQIRTFIIQIKRNNVDRDM